MTKSEIEKLIEYLQVNLPKYVFDEGPLNGEVVVEQGAKIYCPVAKLFKVLREYPVNEEKTCGPNWEAMYSKSLDIVEGLKDENRRLKSNIEILTDEVSRQDKKLEVYAAALNTVEVMTGNIFDFMNH